MKIHGREKEGDVGERGREGKRKRESGGGRDEKRKRGRCMSEGGCEDREGEWQIGKHSRVV